MYLNFKFYFRKVLGCVKCYMYMIQLPLVEFFYYLYVVLDEFLYHISTDITFTTLELDSDSTLFEIEKRFLTDSYI